MDSGRAENKVRSGFNRAVGQIPAGEQQEKAQNELYGSVFQLPRGARA
jgi:hypothetical protein